MSGTNERELAPWERDRHEGLQVGDPTPELPDDVAADCPFTKDGYYCTRSKGHDGHDHVATGRDTVRAVWAWGEGTDIGTEGEMDKFLVALDDLLDRLLA